MGSLAHIENSIKSFKCAVIIPSITTISSSLKLLNNKLFKPILFNKIDYDKFILKFYKIKNYSTLIECNFEFIEFLENKEYLRSTYKKSIERCKFVLCPRGRGSNSIRFYEALNFGKIPILISDDVKLPLESKINH